MPATPLLDLVVSIGLLTSVTGYASTIKHTVTETVKSKVSVRVAVDQI